MSYTYHNLISKNVYNDETTFLPDGNPVLYNSVADITSSVSATMGSTASECSRLRSHGE